MVKKRQQTKRCLYKGFTMRSTFELRCALILEKAVENGDIKSWNYPNSPKITRCFIYKNKEGEIKKYYIDFTFIDNNNEETIIEVKGYTTENDLYKWEAVRNKGYKLIVWELKDLIEQENKYNIFESEICELISKCIKEHDIRKKERIKKRQLLSLYRESKPKCLYCNEEFIPNYIRQKFCCKKHHKLHDELNFKNKNNIIKCPYCNINFIVKHSKQKFCCTEHHKLFHKKEITTLQCLYCNKKFIKKQGQQKFCCKEHGNIYRKLLKNKKQS